MVQTKEENHNANIYSEMGKLKQALDLVVDALSLPPCNDINIARKMIRDAVEKDTNV